MRTSLTLFFTSVFFFFTFVGSAQIFDGHSDKAYKISYETGKYNYVEIGADRGITDFLSYGISINYLIKPEDLIVDNFLQTVGIEARLDFHFSRLLNIDRIDILTGLDGHFGGSAGLHISGEYYFNDFIGIFGRGTYHYFLPKEQTFNVFTDSDRTTLSFGVIFKTY